jgi:hypothetical protein
VNKNVLRVAENYRACTVHTIGREQLEIEPFYLFQRNIKIAKIVCVLNRKHCSSWEFGTGSKMYPHWKHKSVLFETSVTVCKVYKRGKAF